MTKFSHRSPLFHSEFSADLARSTVAALRESALSEGNRMPSVFMINEE